MHPGTAKRTPPAAVELVRELGPTTSNDELVVQLNTAGLTTGHGRDFDVAAVQWIRHAYHIPPPSPYADDEISVPDAAYRLDCSTGVIYYWIHTEQLTARRGSSQRFCIPWNYYWIETGKLLARRDRRNRLHIPWNSGIEDECRRRTPNPDI